MINNLEQQDPNEVYHLEQFDIEQASPVLHGANCVIFFLKPEGALRRNRLLRVASPDLVKVYRDENDTDDLDSKGNYVIPSESPASEYSRAQQLAILRTGVRSQIKTAKLYKPNPKYVSDENTMHLPFNEFATKNVTAIVNDISALQTEIIEMQATIQHLISRNPFVARHFTKMDLQQGHLLLRINQRNCSATVIEDGGISLAQYYASEAQNLHIGQKFALIEQLGLALNFLGQNKMSFVDVKTINALVDTTQTFVSAFGFEVPLLKLCDYGGAVREGEPAREVTPLYSPPEVSKKLIHILNRSDQYSAGLIAFELLVNNGLNMKVMNTINIATSKDPSARYKDTWEFIINLAIALDLPNARQILTEV